MAKVAPGRASGRISKPRLAALVDAIRTVLVSAIEAGGSSLRDYARPNGDLGYFPANGAYTGAKERPACAARRFAGGPRAVDRPSIAPLASARRLTIRLFVRRERA